MSDQVKFGADATEYFDVLARMQSKLEELERSHGKFGQGANGFRNLSRSHDELLESNHRVAHSIASVTEEITSGGSVADVAATSFESLARSLNLPISPLAVLLATGAGIAELHKQTHEADVALKDFHHELNRTPISSVGLGNTSALLAQIEKEADLAKRARERIGGFPNAVDQSREGVRDEERQRRRELEEHLREQAGRETSVSTQGALGDDRGAEKLKAQLDLEQRISEIELNRHTSEYTKFVLISDANENYRTQLALIDKIHDSKDRDIALSKSLATTPLFGDFESVVAAEEKLSTALENQASLRKAGNNSEREAAAARVAEAETELNLTRQIVEMRQEQVELGLRFSSISASVAQILPDLSSEDRQRAQLVAKRDQAFASYDAEQFSAQAEEDRTGSVSDATIARLTQANAAQLQADADLVQYDQERAFSHEQTLTAAKATTSEMFLQANGFEHLAELTRIREDYESKIRQHQHEGREDLVEQDKLQENIARTQSKASEFLKSPKQKYQEYLDQINKERGFQTVRAQERDQAGLDAQKHGKSYESGAKDYDKTHPLKTAAEQAKESAYKTTTGSQSVGNIGSLVNAINNVAAKLAVA